MGVRVRQRLERVWHAADSDLARDKGRDVELTAGDKPVVGATVSVVGGMPAHDHGLPTRPRITEDLGEGSYRLEGMRFHMNGDWEVSIEIEADGKTDTVVITLRL